MQAAGHDMATAAVRWSFKPPTANGPSRSASSAGANETSAGVYARVSSFKGWIDDTIKRN